MSIRLSLASKKEIKSLVAIFESIVSSLPYYNEDAKKNEISKYKEDELVKKLDDDSQSIILAYDENQEIVGFCLSRLDDMLVWLEWFAVVDFSRGKGIGREIIKYLEFTALKRGAHKVWCDCRTENIKSIILLSKCGYLPICTLKNHWYKQDFILWQKDLTSEVFYENKSTN